MHAMLLDLLRICLTPTVLFLFGFGVLPVYKCPAKNRRFLERHGRFLVSAGVMTAIIASVIVFRP